MHSYKGFSLIELMVAVAIIGILSAVAISAYKNYIIRGKVAGVISALEGAKMKVNECIVFHGAKEPCDANASGVDTAVLDHTMPYLWRSKVDQGTVSASVDWIDITGSTWLSMTGVYYPPRLILQPTLTESGIAWICGAERDTLFPYIPADCRRVLNIR